MIYMRMVEHLESLGLGHPIRHANTDEAQPPGAYIEVVNVPGEAEVIGRRRQTGSVFQVSLFRPLNEGPGPSHRDAKAIQRHFDGRTFYSDGTRASCLSPTINPGAVDEAAARYRTTVDVTYLETESRR